MLKKYSVAVSYKEDGEDKINQARTHKFCKRKARKYLRYIMKYKKENYEFNFLHIFPCNDEGKMLDKEYIRFVFNKKEIGEIYL